MNYKDDFKSKCSQLQSCLKELNTALYDIKEKIIIRDLEGYFHDKKDIKLTRGSNCINISEIDEIIIEGENFNIINTKSEKYFGFVITLKKEFCTNGLGFEYKDDVISPHMDFQVDSILNKYNNDELIEIVDIIDSKISIIKSDIEYTQTHKDLDSYKYYYGEYNKGFSSNMRFNNINEVMKEFINH